jgi:hypothetical protein
LVGSSNLSAGTKIKDLAASTLEQKTEIVHGLSTRATDHYEGLVSLLILVIAASIERAASVSSRLNT